MMTKLFKYMYIYRKKSYYQLIDFFTTIYCAAKKASTALVPLYEKLIKWVNSDKTKQDRYGLVYIMVYQTPDKSV